MEIQKHTGTAISPFSSGDAFQSFWATACSLADSTMVPKDFRTNPNNCMVALDMANRMNASALAVMQNLYIIDGKPSWSSSFIIAAVKHSGIFSALRWEEGVDGEARYQDGAWHTIPNRWKRAYATELATGQIVYGPRVDMQMAINEGWYTKTKSKWKTMPELMLTYRSAAFFGRMYCPDILMGLKTTDEARDIEDGEYTELTSSSHRPSPADAVKNIPLTKSPVENSTVAAGVTLETSAEHQTLEVKHTTGRAGNKRQKPVIEEAVVVNPPNQQAATANDAVIPEGDDDEFNI